MSKQANPKLVGAFVLGAVTLLVAAVVLLADGGFWRERPSYVMYFEGSATGLQVGSLVVFRGVKIGTVHSIGLSVDEQSLNFLVPVVIRTDEYAMKNLDGDTVALSDLTENKDLIKRGLRGRLKTLSFLTGQLYIDLDFYPDKPATYHGKDNGMREIPTLPTEVEELTNKLDKLNVEKLVDDISTISASVRSLRAMSGEDSVTTTRLNAVLKETTAAARALRVLAEAIETQPESLLSGRRREGTAE